MKIMLVSLALSFIWLSGCQHDDGNLITGPDMENLIQHGLDPDSIAMAVKNAEGLPNFYGLLVIKDQEVLVEEFFKGKTSNNLYHIRSITKNFTSALTAMAIREGILDSLDMPIQSHFTSLETSKGAITIRHLLNMSSGIAWDEDTEVIPLLEHNINMPVNNFLSRVLISEPGSHFNYNSVSPHVVSSIISDIAQVSFGDFAAEQLFKPLGISEFLWEKDPQGNEWGGLGLQMRPSDIAKFGQLYLNGGNWEGQQLVPEEWVTRSQTSQIAIPGGTSGYSLQWYVADNLSTKVYYGQGYGGQALMLIPEKNMMIIGLQEYLVSFQQHASQWSDFLNKVFNPIYRSMD